MFFLPCILSNNPEEHVSSGSDNEPTNAGDTKVIAPFGVMPIKTLQYYDMFFLPCSLSNNPEERVSSGSDIEPTNAGDTKVIAPFGVMPIKTLQYVVAPS